MSKYPSDCCIHVSTDIVESIFGKCKNKANSYPFTGLTKLNLELPLYCMSEKEIAQLSNSVLEGISMIYLCQWLEEYSADNQLVKRMTLGKTVA